MKYLLSLLLALCTFAASAQTWVDSLDTYAREVYLPAKKYKWTWVNAALLKVVILEYDNAPANRQQQYLDYVKTAMQHSWKHARGGTPNAVASGLGMAFLYRATHEQKYLDKALKIYADYLKIDRCSNGGVSHLRLNRELWDDTIYMIGQFLLEMYRATGDVKYINEFVFQVDAHHEKLSDSVTGLWYHGWDNDNDLHFTFCSQRKWPGKQSRHSPEFWGRGNGWVVVTLADALKTIPKDNPAYDKLTGYLKEMLANLPKLQDETTGHWYQLPVRKGEAGNWIESSCTAMFAYGINTALQLGIVKGKAYQTAVDRAYTGLREYSIYHVSNGYLNTQNICKGTCIGDADYYYNRGNQTGKAYGLGAFIQFGMMYELSQGK